MRNAGQDAEAAAPYLAYVRPLRLPGLVGTGVLGYLEVHNWRQWLDWTGAEEEVAQAFHEVIVHADCVLSVDTKAIGQILNCRVATQPADIAQFMASRT
jgi:hypothetical protein